MKMSDRVDVEWFEQVGPKSDPGENEIAVSGIGLIAAAKVTPKNPNDGEPFIAVSMYASWNPETGSAHSGRSITSDLSALVIRTDLTSHCILAAGDLNDWYGSGAYKDVQANDPIYTRTDRFDYTYHIYGENDLYTVVVHRPNGDAFYIRRKVWKTLWGRVIGSTAISINGRTFDETLPPGRPRSSRVSGKGWVRSAWSSWGRSIRTGGKHILCPISCHRTPGTWSLSADPVKRWRMSINSSTTCSHRDSTRVSRCAR